MSPRLKVWSVCLLGLIVLPSDILAQEDPYTAGRFDNGKMWTFEYPPGDYFSDTYGFDASSSWFEEARLGTLRIPGCTASFASPYGLVLTNHHCGRSAVAQVTREDEDLLNDGFYASTLDAERQVPDYYADQLIRIDDVSEEVFAALEGAQTDAERADALDTVSASIVARLQEEGGEHTHVEVIPLYHGGRYSAYVFHRYTDVRLVMTPELALGYFGGDSDNFTFPRYVLDMTFFRVYDEEGSPLETDHYFTWSLEGARNGMPVFVVGNPGTTSRLETVSQLNLRRDVTDHALLAFISSRVEILQEQLETTPSLQNTVFSLLNAQKAYTGQQEALRDEMIMSRKQDAETSFRREILRDESLRTLYGEALEEMAQVQEEMRAMGGSYGAFFAFGNPTYESSVLVRAMTAVQYLSAVEGASEEQTEALKEQLLGIADKPATLDEVLLAVRLDDIATYFSNEPTFLEDLMGEQTPAEWASNLIATSVFRSAEATQDAIENNVIPNDDPAISLAGSLLEKQGAFQSAWAGLTARQSRLASNLGRARFEVYGTDIPPDATFSLRIADGVVQGYSYNGTYAAPFTSYYGLYDHYHSYGAGGEWDLPEKWINAPSTFDRSIRLNFVSTNDITGGNSGSPVLNQDLELVGLIFDGNIESLSGTYIYLPDRQRSVSVDVRGILEALDEIYDADRLVVELTAAEFYESEEEADQRAEE